MSHVNFLRNLAEDIFSARGVHPTSTGLSLAADELSTLRTQNQQLRAALVRAREEFEHFTEYWNGDSNYQAMNNALNHIEFGARKQSEKIDAILSGQPDEDPRDEALRLAREALENCEGVVDELRDYPITHDLLIEALAAIDAVIPLPAAPEAKVALYTHPTNCPRCAELEPVVHAIGNFIGREYLVTWTDKFLSDIVIQLLTERDKQLAALEAEIALDKEKGK